MKATIGIGLITVAAAVSFGTGVWADAPSKSQRETGQTRSGQQSYQCSQESQQGFQAQQLNQQRYQERWNQLMAAEAQRPPRQDQSAFKQQDTQSPQRQDPGTSAFKGQPSAERQGMNQGSSDPQGFDRRAAQDGRGIDLKNSATQGSSERQDMNRSSSDSNALRSDSSTSSSKDRQGMNRGSADNPPGFDPTTPGGQQGSRERQEMNQKPSDSNQQGLNSQDTRGGDQSTRGSASSNPPGFDPNTPGGQQGSRERQGMSQSSPDSNLQASNQTNRHGTTQGASDTRANAQTLSGEFVGMYGNFYIIKDAGGQQLCIPSSYVTTLDGVFIQGDTIEARIEDGSATRLRRVGNFPDMRMSGSSSQPGSGSMSGTGSMSRSDATTGAGSGSGSMSSSESQMGMGTDSQQSSSLMVIGELLKIKDDFYTVKDTGGNEVRLHVNKETKIQGAPKVGDKIEAQRTAAGHALSIKKAGS